MTITLSSNHQTPTNRMYFNDAWGRFYQAPSLQDLFKTVKPDVILDLLKAERCTGFCEALVIA